MKGRGVSLLLLLLVAVFLLPVRVAARQVHGFDCTLCHQSLSSTEIPYMTYNLCLVCHFPGNSATYALSSIYGGGASNPVTGTFASGDASNALGSYPPEATAGEQTSHYWAGADDVVPAAGAGVPADFLYNFGWSKGKITCSRCHDPHAEQDNPQLLRMGEGSTDAMCLDCHQDWNLTGNHGRGSHPLYSNYPALATANPSRFKPAPGHFGTNGGISLVDGIKVSCSSCHGVHFADSDASTVDGPSASLNAGDGKLLKFDGSGRENPDQSLCQTCHAYEQHGGSSGLGCMVCHGGHEYDAGGNPNYFLLKKQVALTHIPKTGAAGTVNFDYTLYPAPVNLGGICEECHTLPAGHDTGASCKDCHAHRGGFVHGAVSDPTGCAACHGPAHETNSTSAWITFFANGSDHAYSESGPVDTFATCSMCHVSNLLAQHANDCALCHAGSSPPRDSFTTWNKTCQQGSCHPSFHPGASDAHDTEYFQGSDCDRCHVHVGWSFSWDGVASAGFCGECHSLGVDPSAPVSFSDLQASYWGTALISIWANDARAVKASYYRLDGGPITAYSVPITVTPPAEGSKAHSLEYWSRDWSGNIETPHKFGTFTVAEDTVAPVTTSNAKAAYGGTATILLTPTDNGTSQGVAATYYRFDDGPVNSGTTAVMAEPASGSEIHTLYFWSVDHAGNVEAEKSATFTITADEIAPTSTTSLLPLPKIYGRIDLRNETHLDFSLAASDPDPASGVAGIRVTSTNTMLRFDNGSEAWWDGTSWRMTIWNFITDGSFPVSYAARDHSGNVESAKIVTITIDRTRPVTTSNAVAEYSGTTTITLLPTDATSGVASTYYKDGSGGTVMTGTTAVIAPPASGSAVHTLYFWSVDNVGNVESNKSATFTIYAEGTDIAPPAGSVSINAGAAWTNSTSATLTLSASDGSGSGLSQMRFSNDNASWSGWEAYATSKVWTLTAGAGTKTVYVQFRDVVGNVSTSTSDTIGLESTAPATTSTAAGGATYFSDNFSGIKTFTLTATDAGGSGVAGTWWQLDSTAGSWTSGTSVPVPAPVSGTAAHTLYWYSRDNAGNQEAQKSVPFTMEAGGTETTALIRAVPVYVEASPDAAGASAYYEIYADDVLIGTKAADATTTWNCPQTPISSGGHIDIVVYAGFSSYGEIYDQNTPYTYTLTLPTGTTRLAAATWSGFSNKSVALNVYDDYYDDLISSIAVPVGTIGNIVYATTTPDATPPVTTANAAGGAVYVGNQTFTLSASDAGGTGVAGTWWQLDSTGGSWTSGTSVPVAAPVSGTAARTIYWYSRDYANNQESLKSVSVNLEAVGTASTSLAMNQVATAYADLGATLAWANYKIYADDVLIGNFNAPTAVPPTDTNQTFNWNCPQTDISSGGHIDIVVDAGFTNNVRWPESNVPLTYTINLPVGSKRLEAATWTGFKRKNTGDDYDEEWDEEYTYVSVPAGTVGNIRYATTGSDIIAPVTTCNAVDGAVYVGGQTFILSPSDSGGSGVESTWWQLDSTSGSWTLGTSVAVPAPVSGTAVHTLYWYSRDAASNQETRKSVSFSVTAAGGG